MSDDEKIKKAFESPALSVLSEHYPPNRFGRVPLKVQMACNVRSELPFSKPGTIARNGEEYYVWCNSHGAVSAILDNGECLGLRPCEFNITEWHILPTEATNET